MPVVLRQEAVKSRKGTGEERLYAPIEKNGHIRFPQDRFGASVQKGVNLNFPHLDHHTFHVIGHFLLLTLEPMCLCLCIFCAFVSGVLYSRTYSSEPSVLSSPKITASTFGK